MARADALRLGPFVGGLNSGSDPTAVADSELVDMINFELDIDGSLVQRPPIVSAPNSGGTTNMTIIGSAIISNVSYLVGCDGTGVWVFDGTTWTLAKSGLESRVALQYRNKIYIVATPGSSTGGGYYDPVAPLFTADASMPRGESAVFSKSRLFIVPGLTSTTNTSRLTFTDPIISDTLSWPGANIIDVSPGDGQNLIDVVVYNDNLLLFKQDSTYVLAYDLQPSDAILRNINTTIGATTRYCVKPYENSIFVYHEGKVYEIVNYDFAQINIKVPFFYDGTVPSGTTREHLVFLSLIGDRLLVRYYNRIYVYGLKTKTWGRWVSDDENLHNFGPLMAYPSNPTQQVNTRYYGGSVLNERKQIQYIPDGWDSTTKENNGTSDIVITSTLITKNYDLADSHHFKKMMWWGADILTNQDVIGRAEPIVTNFAVTWLQLSTKKWGELVNNFWSAPLVSPVIIETDVDILSNATRKFVKFKKTLRFRQINYSVVLQGDGSTATGPCRVFTLTAIIGSKETVSKQVS
jgi:hypothetical protein